MMEYFITALYWLSEWCNFIFLMFIIIVTMASNIDAMVVSDKTGALNNQNTKLLLVNGTASQMTDLSVGGTPKTIIASGNAQWVSTSLNYGQTTILFNELSSNIQISTTNMNDFKFVSSDWTIDWYGNIPNVSLPTFMWLVALGDYNDNSDLYFSCAIQSTRYINFYLPSANGSVYTPQIDLVALPRNLWVHYAIVQNDNAIHLFVSGNLRATIPITRGGLKYPATMKGFYYIAKDSWHTAYFHKGNMTNIRITNGQALWRRNFLPPRLSL